jgi:hypothetical protein
VESTVVGLSDIEASLAFFLSARRERRPDRRQSCRPAAPTASRRIGDVGDTRYDRSS